MPVTFGSVGDIIAVALLAKDLVEALDQCRGSQAEYRQLIQELRILEEVLRKVDHLCNSSGTSGASFETVALHQTALKITDSSRNLIQAFAARLAKYDRALGDNTQKKNAIKSAFAQIRWQVGEKEDVIRFRAEITAQTTSLSVLLGATTWGVGKDTQQFLKNLDDKVTQQFNVQTNILSNITMELVEAKTVFRQAGSISGALLTSLSRVGELCTQIKAAVSSILFVNIATYKAVLALQNLLPSHLERSLINEPFVLEDAIGRMSPVHLQFISSWAAFEAVLETRFRGIQGYEKVVNGKWTLQDHATGRDISRKSCWEGAFLPGQRVDMSLLFERETTVNDFDSHTADRRYDKNGAACPRCQADVAESGHTDIQCANCGLCFRRVTEVHETTPGPTPPRPNPWEKKPTFGKPSLQPTFGPAPPAKKRRQNTVDDFDVSSFKRIRIHSKLNTIKRHVFVSQAIKSSLHPKAAVHVTLEPDRKHESSLDLLSSFARYHEVTRDDAVDVLSTEDHRQQGGNSAEHIPLSDTTLDVHLSYLPRSTLWPSIPPPEIRIEEDDPDEEDDPIQAASSPQPQRSLEPNPKIASPPQSALYNEALAECLLEHHTKGRANNSSALYHAVLSSHESCARTLLDQGADVNTKSEHLLSPITAAVARGDKDMVTVLLGYGADIYTRMSTPLQTAVLGGEAEIFQLLLERGEADPFADTSMLSVMEAINRRPSEQWVFMRILQLSAVTNIDADDFTDSGPYTNPSAARRDRDRLFSNVLSESTIRDSFVCNLVENAADELGLIAVAEILSTTRHDSGHEELDEKHSGESLPSEDATALGKVV